MKENFYSFFTLNGMVIRKIISISKAITQKFFYKKCNRVVNWIYNKVNKQWGNVSRYLLIVRLKRGLIACCVVCAWKFYLWWLGVARATAQSEGCILTIAQSMWSRQGGASVPLLRCITLSHVCNYKAFWNVKGKIWVTDKRRRQLPSEFLSIKFILSSCTGPNFVGKSENSLMKNYIFGWYLLRLG